MPAPCNGFLRGLQGSPPGGHIVHVQQLLSFQSTGRRHEQQHLTLERDQPSCGMSKPALWLCALTVALGRLLGAGAVQWQGCEESTSPVEISNIDVVPDIPLPGIFLARSHKAAADAVMRDKSLVLVHSFG